MSKLKAQRLGPIGSACVANLFRLLCLIDARGRRQGLFLDGATNTVARLLSSLQNDEKRGRNEERAANDDCLILGEPCCDIACANEQDDARRHDGEYRGDGQPPAPNLISHLPSSTCS
ncbi:hypothetical protein QCE49_05875 [Caballeronia sp. LZ008]|uniref:hypothetical protein n=1 Tax=unclassified Caballeronia TaxID=2646786 RepID=UPI0020293938|nr:MULTISPECIES: hypothetical protein [unclassified Caballeronia]MDR5792904.1 hypothetical protein [Caballeronia sp. LZ008]